MAKLLVSVRSANEALLAFTAGADIIDVKEPDLGSLGRAEVSTWRQVRSVLPASVPLSVALGELNKWVEAVEHALPADAWNGLSFRKLGLAGVSPDWQETWRGLRLRLGNEQGPPWIAVAYADWLAARAPDPDAVLEAAGEATEIIGILVDTWSKTAPFQVDAGWIDWAHRVRQAGLMLAVAGGLDRRSIPALAALAPDVVAVRGAACVGGSRRAAIDPDRVSALVLMAASLPLLSDSLLSWPC